MNSSSRLLVQAFLFLATCTAIFGFVSPRSFDSIPRTVPDFGVYYSAAKLSQRGINPFNRDTLQAEYRSIDPTTPPMHANSGPGTLGVTMPFTGLDFAPARLVWLFLQIAMLIYCGDVLWQMYGGTDTHLPFVWLVMLGSYPCVQTLWLGQYSVLVLTGFVTFAKFSNTLPFLAGLGLSLLLVKPQNQLLVIALGTIWMIDRRQGRIFAGLLLGTVALSALATLGNPAIFSQYFHMLTNEPPTSYWPPVLGSLFRVGFGPQHFSLTFVPLGLGLLWAIAHYYRHRETWHWLDRLPLLLLVSYLASPYGWAYDHLVFLFAYFQVAAIACRRSAVWWLPLLGFQFAMTGYYFFMLNRAEEFHWVWLAPTVTLAYVIFWSGRR